MKKLSLQKLSEIITGKCPNCGKSKVFYAKKNSILSLPEMKDECENCQFKFNGEPGYFMGAMYVSYALAVLQGIVTFLFLKFVLNIHSLPLIIAVTISAIILLSKSNFKLSRVIWMNVFPK